MKHLHLVFYCLVAVLALSLTSCDDDEGGMGSGTLALTFGSITQPGAGYVYVVWLREGGTYNLLGDFTITDNGLLSSSTFALDRDRLNAAEGVLVTLEVEDNITSTPGAQRFMAGDFVNKGAVLSISHPDAIAEDFDGAAAAYIVTTPTDDDTTNEDSGIWFYDTTAMASTLMLPELSANWIYESWMIFDDTTTVSLGKFSNPLVADQAATFSGSQAGFNAPGEDFLTGNSLFPTSVLSNRLFISVEPVPDDAVEAFGIRLFSEVVIDTITANPVPMDFNTAGLSRGLATRN